jgi:hypothetical protein
LKQNGFCLEFNVKQQIREKNPKTKRTVKFTFSPECRSFWRVFYEKYRGYCFISILNNDLQDTQDLASFLQQMAGFYNLE